MVVAMMIDDCIPVWIVNCVGWGCCFAVGALPQCFILVRESMNEGSRSYVDRTRDKRNSFRSRE